MQVLVVTATVRALRAPVSPLCRPTRPTSSPNGPRPAAPNWAAQLSFTTTTPVYIASETLLPLNTNKYQRIPKTVDRFKLRQTNITKRPAQPEPGYSHGGRISTAAPQCVNKSQIRAWAARVSPPMRWSVCLWFRLIQYVIQNMFSMLPLNMLMANLCSDV